MPEGPLPHPHFTLTLWTADPVLAGAADAAGIDRIGPDLERRGKQERQRGLGTWVSPQLDSDVATLSPVLSRARLFVRLDRLHAGSARHAERSIDAGANVVMIPMAEDPVGLASLGRAVGDRATLVALIETGRGMEAASEIAAVAEVDELHVGLNDLSLSLGLPNRFLALAHPALDRISEAASTAGKPLGVGGIGRAGDTALPIPSDLVYAQLARVGATAALLARSFRPTPGSGLGSEVLRTRARLAEWCDAGPAAWEEARIELQRLATAAGRW